MLEFYLNSQKKLIADLWELYTNRYSELQTALQSGFYNQIYFSGSDEMLCIFEPSLINKLQCRWCLKGGYREKKPRSKTYHSMYFDQNDVIYKIEFFCDITNRHEDNFKEIFFIHTKNRTVYLVYTATDSSAVPELNGIYLLHFDDFSRLSSFVYSPSRFLLDDLSGEINEFRNHNLIQTIRYSTWHSKYEKFSFIYSGTGYLESYQNIDLQRGNPLIYTAHFSEKNIAEFEKYGRFYFSPVSVQNGYFSIPMKRITL